MSKSRSIFFVEDDISFGSVLKSYLEICQFSVTWINEGKHAFEIFRNGSFDLCLLDVMLPQVDGFTLGHEIRTINPRIPIIYLTAKSMKEDILTGYRVGADDYIVKPFDSEVLLFKINAVLKRAESFFTDDSAISIGSFLFYPALREIRRDNIRQLLTPKESALLKLLCDHQNELLPREMALKAIWGDDGYFTTRSMDVFITRLRKYLKEDSSIQIRNLHGSGFVLTWDDRLVVK